MELLPQELREHIPDVGSDPETPLAETMVYVRLFDPSSSWRWYVLEFDGQDTVFGLVVTDHLATAGQFTLTELRAIQHHDKQLGEVRILRDESFQPLAVRDLCRREPVLQELLEEPAPRETNRPEELIQLT